MRFTVLLCLIPLLLCPAISQAVPAESSPSVSDDTNSADRILKSLEDRYAGTSFSVDFRQESTLEAMDITDTATGRAWFKHPGKMRWEYRKPEKHIIISNGQELWIYRPEDNQVVKGSASEFFGSGKGASFLADFQIIRKAFNLTTIDVKENRYRLKMTPIRKQIELAAIYLEINKGNLNIEKVVTENRYGDLTRIFFDNLEFNPEMPIDLFEFSTPSGADVIEMEEQ